MRVNGNELRLSINGTIVAFTRSSEISISDALREATTKDTSGWKEVIGGVKSAVISFDALLDYTALTLEPLLMEGTMVSFRFSGQTQHLVGQGFIEAITHDGPSDETANYTGSIRVTGELLDEIQTEVNTLCFGPDVLCFGTQELCGLNEVI